MTPQDNFSRVGFLRKISILGRKKFTAAMLSRFVNNEEHANKVISPLLECK